MLFTVAAISATLNHDSLPDLSQRPRQRRKGQRRFPFLGKRLWPHLILIIQFIDSGDSFLSDEGPLFVTTTWSQQHCAHVTARTLAIYGQQRAMVAQANDVDAASIRSARVLYRPLAATAEPSRTSTTTRCPARSSDGSAGLHHQAAEALEVL